MARMRIFRRHSFTRWWHKSPQTMPSPIYPYWGVLSLGALRFVFDRFNRADSAVSLGSAETGQSWVVNAGTWGISSSQAYLVAATAQATAVVNSGKSDASVEVTLVGTGDAGLCWRSSDDNNNYVWSTIAAYKRVAGIYTQLASFSASASGDVLKVVLAGDVHTIYRNGLQIGQFTDAFNNTATSHGLRSNSDTTVRFDDFAVY